MDFKYGDVLPDDYEPDFGDPGEEKIPTPAAPQQEAPAPERTPPPRSDVQPEPPAPAATAPQQKYKYGDVLPDDYKPDFGDDTPAPAAPKPAQSTIGGELLKGAAAGAKGNITGLGSAAQAFQFISDGDENSTFGQIAKYLSSDPSKPDPNAPAVGSWSDIRGPGDAAKYASYMLGSGVMSTLPSYGGAIAGGIGGTAVGGPVGGLVGGYTGAAIPSIGAGIGGMQDALMNDEGVKKALADGTMTKKQLGTWAIAGGSVIGAIDAIGAEKLGLGKFVGHEAEELVKKALLKRIAAGAASGAKEEGITEAIQEILSQGIQAYTGGNADVGSRISSVIDNALGGIITGGALGGGSGAVAPFTQKAKPKDTSTEQEPPGVDAAGSEQPQGQPTPGGTGAVPPPPTGAPATTTTNAPPSIVGGVEAVQPGAVSADIAAVNAPTPTEQSTPAAPSTDQPVVTPIEEDDEEFDYVEGESPTRLTEKKAAATVVAPAGADTAQALAANTVQDQKAAEPQVPLPEAAAPAAQPQAPAPAPVQEQAPAAPVIPQVQEPVVPEAAPAEPLAAQPVEAAAPAEGAAPVVGEEDLSAPLPPAVSEQEVTAAPQSLEDVLAQPEPETALQPAPEPEPAPLEGEILGPEETPAETALASAVEPEPTETIELEANKQLTPTGKLLEGLLHQEFAKNTFSEDPRFAEAVRKVARDMTQALPKGIAPAAAAREMVEEARDRVKRQFVQQMEEEIAQQEADQQANVQAAAEWKQRGKEKRATGAPQERARTKRSTGEKAAADIETEEHRTTVRRARKELAKPEHERDPDLMDYLKASQQGRGEKPTTKEKETRAAAKKRMQEKQAAKETPKATAVAEVKPAAPTALSRANTPDQNLQLFEKMVKAGKVPGGAAELATAKFFHSVGAYEDMYGVMKADVSKEGYGGSEALEHLTDEGTEFTRAKGAKDVSYLEEKEPETFAVTDPDGKTVHIKSGEHVTGARALDEVNRLLSKSAGLWRIFRKMHVKRLKEMVGDQRVIFASPEDMAKVAGQVVAGLYATPSVEEVAAGQKPVVMINSEYYNRMDDRRKAHVLLHELTHAATVFAIDHDFRGARTVIEQMMNRLRMQLIRDGRQDIVKEYGFTNAKEFVAEAYSNERFQQFLKSYQAGSAIMQRIGAISDRAPSWWDHFRAFVQKAMGMLGLGNKSKTYFDAILDLHPDIMMNQAEIERRSVEDFYPGTEEPHSTEYGAAAREPRHVMDFLPMMEDANDRVEASRKQRAGGSLAAFGRNVHKLLTTEELKRQTARFFNGDYDNAVSKEGALLQEREALKRKLAEDGSQVTADWANFQKQNHEEAEKVVDVMQHARMIEADPSKTLAENTQISKKGDRHLQRREQFVELKKNYEALSAKGKEQFKAIGKYFAEQQDAIVQETVENMVDTAIDEGHITLPNKDTKEHLIDWALAGGVDQNEEEMTDREKEMMAALGPVGKMLKGSTTMRKVKGYYVPLMRFGKYFISGKKELALPAGAKRGDPAFEKSPDHESFIFKNKKDAQQYMKTTEDRVAQYFSRIIDPRDGSRVMDETDIKYQGVNLEKQFVVRAVNRVMEMHDNEAELNARKANWAKDGYEMSNVSELAKHMHRGSDVLPANVRSILSSIEQSKMSDTMKEAAKYGVMQSYLKTLSGMRVQQRGLKAKKIYGQSKDMVHILHSNTNVMAGHRANLKLLPRIAVARKATDKALEDLRHAKTDKGLLSLQSIVKEIRDRQEEAYKQSETGGVKRLVNAALSLSFVSHLASPMYSIINAMQPLMTTLPYLAGRHGWGRTIAAMGRALSDAGALSTYGLGMTETAAETTHFLRNILNGTLFRKGYSPRRKAESHYKRQLNLLQSKPGIKNREAKIAALQRQQELGFGTDSGSDAPDTSELGKTRAEIILARVANAFRMLPEAVEAVNRSLTSHMAIDLAMADGMSAKEAVDYATTTVEATQGGYAAANNPRFMQKSWAALPFQFKKFGLMYGQLYYKAALNSANYSEDASPETRAVARKTLAGLTLMTVAMAGVGGLPMMEIGRLGVMLLHGLGFLDDDWDDEEQNMQSAFKAIAGLFMSEGTASSTAEAAMHGLSRLGGVDLSNRLGNDSLVAFGNPRQATKADTKAWLWDQFTGAPGQMISDMMSGVANNDYSKMPWPKFIKDAIKAQSAATSRSKSAAGIEYGPKASGWDLPALAQAGLGLTPARQAEQYELGGEGYEHKQETKAKQERTATMQQWLNASPAQRARIWTSVIVPYNRGKKGKERIEIKDLQRNLKRRQTEAKKNK